MWPQGVLAKVMDRVLPGTMLLVSVVKPILGIGVRPYSRCGLKCDAFALMSFKGDPAQFRVLASLRGSTTRRCQRACHRPSW